jgi:hypothetical protein
MTVQEWSLVVGVMMSGVLALGPWMFMVHGKLAVLATRMANVEAKVDRLIHAHESQLPQCAQHEARLETHEVQLAHIGQRLEDLA